MSMAQVDTNDPGMTIAALRREHSELDARLQQLESNRHLTPSEWREVREIKRMKLRKKDQIHFLQRQLGNTLQGTA